MQFLFFTAWKMSKYGVFSNSVFSCILSKYGKIRTKKKLRIWTLFTQCLLLWCINKLFFKSYWSQTLQTSWENFYTWEIKLTDLLIKTTALWFSKHFVDFFGIRHSWRGFSRWFSRNENMNCKWFTNFIFVLSL